MPKRSRYSRSSRSASGGRHPVADVEPGQRADPVDAVRVAQRLVVGGLQVRVVLDRLADEVLVARRVESVGDDVALGVAEADLAVVVLPGAVGSRPGP